MFLGYGDPDSAHYHNMPNQIRTMNFVDSLIDLDHVKDAFGKDVVVDPKLEAKDLKRPFLVTFPVKSEGEDEDEEVCVNPTH